MQSQSRRASQSDAATSTATEREELVLDDFQTQTTGRREMTASLVAFAGKLVLYLSSQAIRLNATAPESVPLDRFSEAPLKKPRGGLAAARDSIKPSDSSGAEQPAGTPEERSTSGWSAWSIGSTLDVEGIRPARLGEVGLNPAIDFRTIQ